MTPIDTPPLSRLLELIADSQTEIVQVLDRSGKTVYMNEACRRRRIACGLSFDDDASTLIHPDDRDVVGGALDSVLNQGEDCAEVRARFMQSAGKYSWFLARAKRVSVDSEWTGLVIVTGVNIDSLMHAERERDEQKRFFEALANKACDLSAVLTRSGEIVYANEAFKGLRQARGIDLDAPLGPLIHPEDREELLRKFKEVIATGETRKMDVRLSELDGGWRYYRVEGRPILDAQGQVQYLLGVMFDIEDQREQERKLLEAEIAAARFSADQQLGALLGQSLIGVVKTDLKGIIEEVNPAICTMSGYTREQLLARSLLDFADPEHHAALRVVQEAISKGESSLETRIRAFRIADGSTAWLAGHAAPIRNVQGDVVGTVCFAVDVTQQMLAEQALAESEAKYRLLADNAGDYIQLLSVDGQYLYDSPSIVRLLGDKYSSGRRLGEGVTLTHPEDIALEGRVWAEVVRNGSERRVDYRWVLPSGEMRWLECLLRAVRDERGEVVSVLAISRDITDRKQAEQQREQALEQARFANEAKSQFLAKVSHELRTPLNAVTGYGYLLGQTGLDTRQSAYLEQITASSQQLLGLISDVLDLARIEAGQQSVTPAPFTLGALLDSALDVVRPAAQASGIELVCDDTRHLPQQLLGDEGLIKQALLNYLSNAVKFTERGQVRLQVRALSDGPATGGSSHLRFEVHDTGAGIAPGRLGELFQPFAQLRADKRGTGLGLDITRRIVELMGGEVGVHSTLGQGSCFWFSVPLELDAQQTTPQVKPLTPQAAQESPGELAVQPLSARHAGKTILVAEDDIINQALMRVMLERAGLEVAIAGDGEQALQMARAGHYAAVLMDLQMPQMDGIEATRAIRQLPGWQQVPVAALTADVFTETREACLAAGMSEFLGKPVNADKLYPCLLRMLDAEQAR
jgi:PAS domain S-box-containing protein